ncbi:hypothetical protein GCM10009676_27640 [Prauserella halophila]|uniref:Uncharacterized protein n=1 Tax=Prauserella halophila TaxID=185641 RepID=A0ABN1WFL9_9PSEU|nr:hypothetical protein [Prauserella halophila]MCP2235136.1 hypothetical protein [Prauserella halophila]
MSVPPHPDDTGDTPIAADTRAAAPTGGHDDVRAGDARVGDVGVGDGDVDEDVRDDDAGGVHGAGGSDTGASGTNPKATVPNATVPKTTDANAGHHGGPWADAPEWPEQSSAETQQDRADEVERKLTVPVLIAALASIPAVFLTRAGGTAAAIGTVLNWASVAVLVGESVALLWLEGSVRRWLRRYRWQLLVVAATVPAVVFVIGPLQVLRLVLLLGGFHILRARRIVNAGRVVVERLGLGQRRARWVLAGVIVLAGAFSLIVLADPDSRSRHVVEWFVDRVGVTGTVLAGIAAAAVIYAVGQLVTRIRR